MQFIAVWQFDVKHWLMINCKALEKILMQFIAVWQFNANQYKAM